MAIATVRPGLLNVSNRRSLSLTHLYDLHFVDQIQKYMVRLFEETKQPNLVDEMAPMLFEFQRMFELQLNATATQPMMALGGVDDYVFRLRRYLVTLIVISCSNTLSLEDTLGLLSDVEGLVTELSVLSGKLKPLPECDQFVLIDFSESEILSIARSILSRNYSQLDWLSDRPYPPSFPMIGK